MPALFNHQLCQSHVAPCCFLPHFSHTQSPVATLDRHFAIFFCLLPTEKKYIYYSPRHTQERHWKWRGLSSGQCGYMGLIGISFRVFFSVGSRVLISHTQLFENIAFEKNKTPYELHMADMGIAQISRLECRFLRSTLVRSEKASARALRLNGLEEYLAISKWSRPKRRIVQKREAWWPSRTWQAKNATKLSWAIQLNCD